MPTLTGIQNRIIAELAHLEMMDKYNYLIERGKRHRGMDGRQRTDATAVPGCQAQVWVRAEHRGERLLFSADSDSLIIRGILSLLLSVLNNRPPEEIARADLYFICATGLSSHLSPARKNGLALVIRHMQSMARRFSTPEPDSGPPTGPAGR